jgi:hypothetical protein
MFRSGAEMQFLAEQRLRLFRAGEGLDIGEVFVGERAPFEGDDGTGVAAGDVLEPLPEE